MAERLMANFRYRWCMANAYLTQFYAPEESWNWELQADRWKMELWRLSGG